MTLRIDTLRQMVADLGNKQMEYHKFFPIFTDQLIQELGKFLGDTTAVALCPAEGEFNFDHQYRHQGLEIKQGKYRVPVMIRLKNLQDNGYLCIRIRLYFAKDKNQLTTWIEKEKSITFDASELSPLLDTIYENLVGILSSSTWFEELGPDYQRL